MCGVGIVMETDMRMPTGLMPPSEVEVIEHGEVPEAALVLKSALIRPKRKKPKKIPKPRIRQYVQEKRGRPYHEPSDLTRNQVKMFCEMGISQEIMAELLQITRPTLVKHYRAELRHGTTELKARVLTSMFNVAQDPNHKDMVKAAMYVMRAHQNIMGEPASAKEGGVGMPNTITASRTIDVNQLSPEQRQNLREIMMAAQGKTDQLSITHQQEQEEVITDDDDDDGDE